MDKKDFSPMMKHYQMIKAQNPDAIILYRLGDFYEMFFDDAIKASKILDLTLTARDSGMEERAPMCGVPYHAVDNYISRLLAAGEKVAICEQLTAPGEQKGMLQRDVIRIITPGTNTIEEMLDGTVNHYLVSIVRDKSEKNYAVAKLDIVTGEFSVKKMHDCVLTDVEDYLLNLVPSEIISTDDICNEGKKLNSVVCQKLVRFTKFFDMSFSLKNATERLLKEYNAFSLEALGLAGEELAVQALGGLLEYVINTQKRSLTHISAPKIESEDSEMYIDFNTRRNLELTETVSDNKKVGSLLWVLDKTKTGMGARKLRNWVLHPLQKIQDIENRQLAIQELVKNDSMRNGLGAALSKIRDIERLVTRIAYGTISPRACLSLAESLSELPLLKKALLKLKAPFYAELDERYVDLTALEQRLVATINPDAPSNTKDGGYIRGGFSQELDTLRSIKLNTENIIAEFAERQRERTGVPSLKVGYNRNFGYFIEITNAKMPETLPEDYKRKQTLSNAERYVNEELMNLEKEILSANDKSLLLEEKLFGELKQILYSQVKSLKEDADIVATMDAIYSLAEVATANGYVKPKMTNSGKIEIQNGRHPVVESLLKANEFVSNDTSIDKENPVAIITGPNMAGKSTYIRQVAVIVLMAHIGSFVPASKAEIGLVDRIFTRVGASDNLVRGQSTFMVEMLEMANILNGATSNSLLILDEIGRGTSTLDGLSIAWAIVEHILLKIHAKTLFATHYHELSELEKLLPGIKNYRVLIQDINDKIVFLYKIVRGGANRSFGIEVAQIAGVKDEVIKRAKDILAKLSETHELSGDLREKMSSCVTETSVACDQMSLFPEDETFVELKKMLWGVDVNRCTPIEALTILSDMKKLVEKEGKNGKNKSVR